MRARSAASTADGGLRNAPRKVGVAARLPAGRAGRAEAQSRDPQRGHAEEGLGRVAPDLGPRGPDAVRPLAARAADPVRGRLRRRQRRRDRKAGRSARHRGRRRPEPLRPVHQQRRRDLRQDRQHRPRPVRRATHSGPASAARARSRTTATRSSGTTGRPTAGCFRSSRFPTSRTVRSTSASPSRRRTIRPVTTTSTSSRRATTFFTDYGKLGVWPDAYYMSFNMFGPDDAFLGGAYAFDRAAMLAGDPSAAMIAFDTGQEGGVLPSDLDGPTPPPAGRPELLPDLRTRSRATAPVAVPRGLDDARPTARSPDRSRSPAAEFIYPGLRRPAGPVRSRSSIRRSCSRRSRNASCIGWRTATSATTSRSSSTTRSAPTLAAAAVRWYEIRNPGDAPVIYQQGTYAPDANFRWMGSIAMDGNGNIALGYSKSSPAHASRRSRVTGRLAGDPLGLMGAEDVWFAGAGSQTRRSSRWGDYSTMSIDPSDDCTFWYTQEYYAETGGFDFKTRIGAFRFPELHERRLRNAVEGTVTDGSAPLAGATVTATPAVHASGRLRATRPRRPTRRATTSSSRCRSATYDVTASKFGYLPASASGVVDLRRRGHRPGFRARCEPDRARQRRRQGRLGPGLAALREARRLRAERLSGRDPVHRLRSRATTRSPWYRPASPTTSRSRAVAPGYVRGGGPLSSSGRGRRPTPPAGLVANWSLSASAPCSAPGYGPGAFVGPPVLCRGLRRGRDSSGLVGGDGFGRRAGRSPAAPIPAASSTATGRAASGPYAIVNSQCFSRSRRTTPRW